MKLCFLFFCLLLPVWSPAVQFWFVAMILAFSGVIVFLIGLLVRTREKHLLEKQEERERHLEEMDRLKMGFFTNVSHELRTPLTVILGRIELIVDAEKDEGKKKKLLAVLNNAKRVCTLVTQLLDFRKIEEGKIKVEATRGDLVRPLRDWVDSLQILAEQKNISCSLECVDECLGWFDFDKLHTIFINLISNAIKYTKESGEVRVSLQVGSSETDCRAETVEDLSADRLEGGRPSQPYKRYIQFVVEDTGEGISGEHLGHIFDRFYRVPEASVAVGAGIGLNLAKELVDLLGGDIKAESPIYSDREYPGTRFTVLLPVYQTLPEGAIAVETFSNVRRPEIDESSAPKPVDV